MRQIRRWLLVLPALAVLGCAKDAASISGPVVTNVLIATSDYVMGLGAMLHIGLIVYDDHSNPMPVPSGCTWTSSDPSTVTVDGDGNARALALGGPVTITASVAGRTATTRITVRPASVTIAPMPDTLIVGQSVQFTATALDASGATIPAGPTLWSVAPETIATISPAGLVTVVASGTFSVTATIYGISAHTNQVTTGIPSPYDGVWIGAGTNMFGAPQSVNFNVRFGVIRQFVLRDVPSNCGAGYTGIFSLVLGAPIVSDQFTFMQTINGLLLVPHIGGTFTSPTAMNGVYERIGLGSIACPGGGSSGITAAASTYTATRQ